MGVQNHRNDSELKKSEAIDMDASSSVRVGEKRPLAFSFEQDEHASKIPRIGESSPTANAIPPEDSMEVVAEGVVEPAPSVPAVSTATPIASGSVDDHAKKLRALLDREIALNKEITQIKGGT